MHISNAGGSACTQNRPGQWPIHSSGVSAAWSKFSGLTALHPLVGYPMECWDGRTGSLKVKVCVCVCVCVCVSVHPKRIYLR